jgi:hypothetical protein
VNEFALTADERFQQKAGNMPVYPFRVGERVEVRSESGRWVPAEITGTVGVGDHFNIKATDCVIDPVHGTNIRYPNPPAPKFKPNDPVTVRTSTTTSEDGVINAVYDNGTYSIACPNYATGSMVAAERFISPRVVESPDMTLKPGDPVIVTRNNGDKHNGIIDTHCGHNHFVVKHELYDGTQRTAVSRTQLKKGLLPPFTIGQYVAVEPYSGPTELGIIRADLGFNLFTVEVIYPDGRTESINRRACYIKPLQTFTNGQKVQITSKKYTGVGVIKLKSHVESIYHVEYHDEYLGKQTGLFYPTELSELPEGLQVKSLIGAEAYSRAMKQLAKDTNGFSVDWKQLMDTLIAAEMSLYPQRTIVLDSLTGTENGKTVTVTELPPAAIGPQPSFKQYDHVSVKLCHKHIASGIITDVLPPADPKASHRYRVRFKNHSGENTIREFHPNQLTAQPAFRHNDPVKVIDNKHERHGMYGTVSEVRNNPTDRRYAVQFRNIPYSIMFNPDQLAPHTPAPIVAGKAPIADKSRYNTGDRVRIVGHPEIVGTYESRGDRKGTVKWDDFSLYMTVAGTSHRIEHVPVKTEPGITINIPAEAFSNCSEVLVPAEFKCGDIVSFPNDGKRELAVVDLIRSPINRVTLLDAEGNCIYKNPAECRVEYGVSGPLRRMSQYRYFITRLQEQVKALEKQHETNATDRKRDEAHISTLAAEITALGKKREMAEQRVAILNRCLSNRNQQIADLQKQKADDDKFIKQLQDENQLLTNAVDFSNASACASL